MSRRERERATKTTGDEEVKGSEGKEARPINLYVERKWE